MTSPMPVEIVGYSHDLHLLVGELAAFVRLMAFAGLTAAALALFGIGLVGVVVAYRR